MIKFARSVMATPVFNMLKNDIVNGNLAHCYVFSSSDKRSLETLTDLFLELIFCENTDKPCGKCFGCLKVENRTHSDIKYFPERDERLSAGEVSSIISGINYTAFESGKKVFVIKNIDESNPAAQNKLLKTLEEPPADTLFVLQASSAVNLLPTVRSRARIINVDAVDPKVFYEELILNTSLDSKFVEKCVQSGAGNIEKTLNFLEEPEYIEIIDLIFDFLLNCRSSKDVLAFSDRMQKYKERLPFIFESMLIIFRDLMYCACGLDNKIICAFKSGEYKNILNSYNLKTFSRGTERIVRAAERLRANGSGISIIDNLLIGIMEDKAKCQGL